LLFLQSDPKSSLLKYGVKKRLPFLTGLQPFLIQSMCSHFQNEASLNSEELSPPTEIDTAQKRRRLLSEKPVHIKGSDESRSDPKKNGSRPSRRKVTSDVTLLAAGNGRNDPVWV
jgi:hypothetical protein